MKQHNLGRARFIIMEDQLSNIEHMYKMRGKTPENAERLFDLIKVPNNEKKEKILAVFYFALRDTLVSNDLQQAKRLAFSYNQRYRVVTLKGEIIDRTGTVTGGGNTVSRGGMKSTLQNPELSLSSKEMTTLKSSIEATRGELMNIRREINQLKEKEERYAKILEGASLRRTKLDMEINANKQHVKELNARLPELEKFKSNKSNPEDSKRMKALIAQIEQLQKPMQAAVKAASQIEGKIQSLQQRIMEEGGLPLKVQQSKLDGIISRIDDINKSITRYQVQLKTAQKTIEKTETAIEHGKEEFEKENTLADEKTQEREGLTEQAKSLEDAFHKYQEEVEKTEAELAEFNKQYEKIKKAVTKLKNSELDLNNQMETLKQSIEENQTQKDLAIKKLGELEEKKNNLMEGDPEGFTPLKLLTPEEMTECEPKHIKSHLTKLQEKLKTMNPNMAAIAEYRAKQKEFEERNNELQQLTNKRDEQQKLCEKLRKKRFDEFMEGFTMINRKLKEMYRMITLEGDAELEFVDSIDPFSEGIIFSVRPPKKSWKNIVNLSGGEKTLSSLALVFALHHYKPTPLYFMDEIDAALDFKNVSIVAHYIKERTKNAQFIIISLRNNMFELADHLIGIYKPDNCTQSVTINPNQHKIG